MLQRPLLSLAILFQCLSSPIQAMEYVPICDATGKCRRFSRLVMGTDHLIQGGWTHESQPEPTKELAFSVLDEAARQGINLFDTAPIYVGSVEYTFGEWREERRQEAKKNSFYHDPTLNPDRDLYALSKGGFPFDLSWLKELPAGCHSIELIQALKEEGILDRHANDWKNTAYPLRKVPPGTYASHLYCDKELMIDRIAVELGHTLNNLKCDIDVYLMHRDDGDAIGFKRVKRELTPVQRILEAVSSPRIAGRVGLLGWSNWETHRVNESIQLSQASPNLVRPSINSPYFSLLEMGEQSIHALGVQVTHSQMMDPTFQPGIKIMPYSPLGGFSILDQPEPRWENAKAFAKKKHEANDPYWKNVYPSIFTPENEKRWFRAKHFLGNFNRRYATDYTLDQLLNAYALAHPRTDMLAIGAITVEQVKRTVQALEFSKQLSTHDLDYLYSGKTKPTYGRPQNPTSCPSLLQ